MAGRISYGDSNDAFRGTAGSAEIGFITICVTNTPHVCTLNYTYNFGIFRDPGGGPPTEGGHGVIFFWSKQLNM